MLEVRLSADLENLVTKLDDDWETEQVNRLPFPVAYPLARLRSERYAWDLLLKDMLHAILKYLAVVGVSDYLHIARNPDFDLNDELKRLARPMHEGDWLSIVRQCALRDGGRVVKEFPGAVTQLETAQLKVGLSFPKYGLRTDRTGVLSSLVTARNRLYAHGATLTTEEKAAATPQILGLIRVCLAQLSPLWEYELVGRVGEGDQARSYLLRGIRGFQETGFPLGLQGASSALSKEGHAPLPLYPLAYSSASGKGEDSTILEHGAEVYLINQVARSRVPVYLGADGTQAKRPDLSEDLERLTATKQVWEMRRDVELDQVLEFSRTKLANQIETATWNNLYDSERFVPRTSLEEVFRSFLEDGDHSALFVAGLSGSGKTAAILDLLYRYHTAGGAGILLRAVELPTEVVKPRWLERRICEELGFAGSFSDVLLRASSHGIGCFVLVLDGLNEFTAAGRDGSLLFRAVNLFLADHAESAALKIIVSTRSDEGFGAFLPQGRLPADADEDQWLQIDGKPFFEVGPLTDGEAQRVLLKLGVDGATADAMIGANTEAARNPNLLRKAAAGAIDAEDLRRLDERGITARFIDERLGRDRTLRRTVEELVKVMGKERDLTLTEVALTERAPRLLEMLQADGGRTLTTLQELAVLQVIDRRDEQGLPTWSIALAHDTLFEALVIRQRRRALAYRLSFTAGLFLFILIALSVFTNFGVSEVKTRFSERMRVASESVEALELEPSTAIEVQAAYKALFEWLDLAFQTTLKLGLGTLWKVAAALALPLAVLLIAVDWMNHRQMCRDSRRTRVLFFGRHEEMIQSRRLLTILVPVMSVFVAWGIIRTLKLPPQAGREALLIALFPLFLAIATLFFVFWPLVTYWHVREGVRGSALLREYCFSNEALRRRGREFTKLALVFSAAVLYMLFFCQLDGRIFLSGARMIEGREELRMLGSRVDLEIIRDHPVTGIDIEKMEAALRGDPFDETLAIFRGSLMDQKDFGFMRRFLSVLWVAVMILTVGTYGLLRIVAWRIHLQQQESA